MKLRAFYSARRVEDSLLAMQVKESVSECDSVFDSVRKFWVEMAISNCYLVGILISENTVHSL